MDNSYNNNYNGQGSSAYNTQTGNSYNAQTGNSYSGQTQSTYSGQMGQQPYGTGAGPAYNPYQQPPRAAKPPKKHKSGFGVTLAKCTAIALVFGLVAGVVFTGVSYVGHKALGIASSSEKAGEDSKVPPTYSNDTDSAIQQTSTGQAAELTDVSTIVEEVMPSIVAITNIGTVTYQTFWGTQQEQQESCGSGIIVQQDDEYLYIVTNNHVVQNADTLTVQFSNDSTASCEVKGTDPSDDLAVVKVALKNIEADTLQTIKVATIGDSEKLKVGESAIAIGNALGYGQSVSVGYISALGRTVTVLDQTNGTTITNNNMIQTDAAINPGNSGGALLNSKGEVIGINSVKYTDTDVEGFGFAIPMADAMPIVQQLITREKVEETKSAYLGIQGQDISADMAETYNMPQGIYVYQAIEGAAAAEAGIRQGDIITAFDGQSVSTMSELKELLTYYEAGQKVTVTIQRLNNGYEEKEITVTLGSQNGARSR
ncbi:MAG: trypsin-like peptidase domain-containing protein [Lachnospiraceae bacterium]|nr:trypsin-like peptidase domain-containing protein [Lachnospiraceae bacterium]MDY5520574.1 trypsin-like peptidase domain-containing protein [Agathobacter sp.]